jgi:hypothetical protein
MPLTAPEQAMFERAAAKLKMADVNIDLIPANGLSTVWMDIKGLIRFELNEVLVLQKYAAGIAYLCPSCVVVEYGSIKCVSLKTQQHDITEFLSLRHLTALIMTANCRVIIQRLIMSSITIEQSRETKSGV